MKYIIRIFLGIIVSLYFFPFGISFIPVMNTKMILAVFGLIFLCLDILKTRRIDVTYRLLGSIFLALLFSFVCYLSTDINWTTDYSYATYFMSFATWLGGAYAVIKLLKLHHGEVTIRLLTFYLAAVCATQCYLALLIDNVAVVKHAVDAVVMQGQDFLEDVDRLYGIGAYLDPAGVKFAIVLLMIGAVLGVESSSLNKKSMVGLIFAFFTVLVIGSMISRTTGIGAILGLACYVYLTRIFTMSIKVSIIRIFVYLAVASFLVVAAATFLYNLNPHFHEQLRYGFEGFFNWMETGTWETASTNKLNDTMWIWPETTKGWIIGTGLFDGFVYSTDIGYCRFVLYCGLIGLAAFSVFFIYNAIVCGNMFKQYRPFFFLLLCLTFIIWIKVSSDLFVIYALFFCLDYPSSVEKRSGHVANVRIESLPRRKMLFR